MAIGEGKMPITVKHSLNRESFKVLFFDGCWIQILTIREFIVYILFPLVTISTFSYPSVVNFVVGDKVLRRGMLLFFLCANLTSVLQSKIDIGRDRRLSRNGRV